MAPDLPYTTANTSGQTKDTVEQSTCSTGTLYSFVGYHSWANLDIGPTQFKHIKRRNAEGIALYCIGLKVANLECNSPLGGLQ